MFGVTSEGISCRTTTRRGDGYIPRWLAWSLLRRQPEILDVVVIRLRPARDCLAWDSEAWNKEEPRHRRAVLSFATFFVAISAVGYLHSGESMHV